MYVAKRQGKDRVISFVDGQKQGGPDKTSYSPGQSRLAALAQLADQHGAGEPQSQEVAALVQELAAALGLPPQEAAAAVEAAGICDAGMAGLPASLLESPDPLTPLEWELVHTHPVTGAQLARGLGASDAIAQAVTHHHEHWDGSGYPAGLVGEEIPRAARLIHAVVAYTAMVRERRYRASLTPEQALSELASRSGSQFDPAVVKALLRVTTTSETVSS
jgi:HD-GYP domain-containing protein (c-di-GMP phosphodiesterase class II)